MNSPLDEQDLQLLHALQISPRISWAEAARVLGTTATTLAGRWHRLRADGAAWVTVHPARSLSGVPVAFIEIDVAPGERDAVISALCREPRAATIEETASGHDLLVTTFAPDWDSLARFALDDLAGLPGVRRLNTRLATQIHWEGSQWRLDALDRDQQSMLTPVQQQNGLPGRTLPTRDWPLVEALTHDGRRSAADLARITGRKPATVRRQLARLVSSGLVSFRCEIAQLESRWPVMCTWFAQVPQQELERTAQSLTTLPDLRLCASVTGSANLMISVWTGSPGELVSLERRMNEKLPWMVLSESVLTLRTAKRMGWTLDPSGRTTGQVVVPLVEHGSRQVGP